MFTCALVSHNLGLLAYLLEGLIGLYFYLAGTFQTVPPWHPFHEQDSCIPLLLIELNRPRALLVFIGGPPVRSGTLTTF